MVPQWCQGGSHMVPGSGMVSLGLVGRLPCSWFAACGSQLRSVAVCALAPWLRVGVAPMAAHRPRASGGVGLGARRCVHWLHSCSSASGVVMAWRRNSWDKLGQGRLEPRIMVERDMEGDREKSELEGGWRKGCNHIGFEASDALGRSQGLGPGFGEQIAR